jgi:hypothetical protein
VVSARPPARRAHLAHAPCLELPSLPPSLLPQIFAVGEVSQQGRAALAALEAALAPPPPRPPPPPGGWAGPTGSGAPGVTPPRPHPPTVRVVCNGNPGAFMLPAQLVRCGCAVCAATAAAHYVPHLELTPTEFERHSGMGASKKWKYTLRVGGDNGSTLGQWLDDHHIVSRYTRSTRGIDLAELPLAPGVTVVKAPERAPRSPREAEAGAEQGGGGEAAAGRESPPRAQPGGAAVVPAAVPSPPRGRPQPPPPLMLRASNSRLAREAAAAAAASGGGGGGGGAAPAARSPHPHRPLNQMNLNDDGDDDGAEFKRYAALPPRTNRDPRQRPPGPGPAGGAGGAGGGGALRSPSGKAWLSPLDRPEGAATRVGASYQAELPPYGGPASRAGEGADARRGAPGPSAEAARASAAGREAAAAQSLPADALDDGWAAAERRRRADAGDAAAAPAAPPPARGPRGGGGRAPAGGDAAGARAQRQRKQPLWMRNTVDPNAALGGKAMVGREVDDREEPPQPYARRPPSGADGGGGPAAKRPRLGVELEAALTAEVDAALEAGCT